MTGCIFTMFHLGGALGHSAAAILVTRLFAGTFGSARTELFHDVSPSLLTTARSFDKCWRGAERYVDPPRTRLRLVVVRHGAMDGTR